jgi:hypothetical protein
MKKRFLFPLAITITMLLSFTEEGFSQNYTIPDNEFEIKVGWEIHRASLVYIPFRDVILHNPKLRFRGEMTVDVTKLAVRIPSSFQTTELQLVNAVHS